jgi:hypothetical protein
MLQLLRLAAAAVNAMGLRRLYVRRIRRERVEERRGRNGGGCVGALKGTALMRFARFRCGGCTPQHLLELAYGPALSLPLLERHPSAAARAVMTKHLSPCLGLVDGLGLLPATA